MTIHADHLDLTAFRTQPRRGFWSRSSPASVSLRKPILVTSRPATPEHVVRMPWFLPGTVAAA